MGPQAGPARLASTCAGPWSSRKRCIAGNLARGRKKFRTLAKIRCLSLRYVAGEAAASPFSSCRCCSGV